jgi:hypothetical protein
VYEAPSGCVFVHHSLDGREFKEILPHKKWGHFILED